MKLKWAIFAIAIALLCLASPAVARADTFTLGTGYQYVTLNNQFVVGLITGSTLNGKAIGPVICDTSDKESFLGSTWMVNVNPLTGPWSPPPMFSGVGATGYEVAAIAEYDMTLPANQNQNEQNLLQDLVWDEMIPGSGAAITGLPVGADNTLLAQIATEVGNYNYSGSIILTPAGNDPDQEFLEINAVPDPVPEPASRTLTLVGLLFGLSALGYKQCFRRALQTHRPID